MAEVRSPVRLQQVVRQVRRYLGTHIPRHGIKATLYDIACRVINAIIHFQVLRGMTVRVEDVNDPSLFEAPGFEGRFIGAEELTKFASDRAYDLSVDFMNQAFARGDRCYGFFDGQTLASYGWYSELPTPIDEHFVLQFDRAYAYMYKGYTLPAYRGKQLHAVGMCRALRACTQEGKKGLISYVLSNNFASLKSTTRVGYRLFGKVYVVRMGSPSFTYATKGCRDYGFGVEASNRAHSFGWAKRMSHD